jgi:hypothetical protein
LHYDEEKGSVIPFVKKFLAYGLSGAILAVLAYPGGSVATRNTG